MRSLLLPAVLGLGALAALLGSPVEGRACPWGGYYYPQAYGGPAYVVYPPAPYYASYGGYSPGYYVHPGGYYASYYVSAGASSPENRVSYTPSSSTQQASENRAYYYVPAAPPPLYYRPAPRYTPAYSEPVDTTSPLNPWKDPDDAFSRNHQ